MLLDEYLQGELSPNRLPPTWVSRTKFVFQSDDGNLAVYETTNNTVKTLVTNYTLVSSTRIDSENRAAVHTLFGLLNESPNNFISSCRFFDSVS